MMKAVKSILNSSFLKFAVVGFLGIISNLSIFFILVDIFKLWPNAIAVLAFVVVSIQNYTLNHLWTFRNVTNGQKLSFYGWFKFILSSLVGFGMSFLVLNLILFFFVVPYKVIAQTCGVGTGFVFNYLGSKFFVFRKKAHDKGIE
jgi:dolichol-phosphate mannosyltransferase